MPITKKFLHFPPDATVSEVLRAYHRRDAQWWWFLTTKIENEYFVCTFGSLLPYLTGRTDHIVHRPGACAICSGLDPVLWRDTDRLVREALRWRRIYRRKVSSLPMAPLLVRDVEKVDPPPRDDPEIMRWLEWVSKRTRGVTEDGVLVGVNFVQEMGALGGAGPPML